jgi:hypothetical protein
MTGEPLREITGGMRRPRLTAVGLRRIPLSPARVVTDEYFRLSPHLEPPSIIRTFPVAVLGISSTTRTSLGTSTSRRTERQ